MNILLFIIGCVFTQNVVFVQLLGSCEMKENRRVKTAACYGIAAVVVMALSSALTWLVQNVLLTKLNAEYLQLISFVLVIILCALLVERLLAMIWPAMGRMIEGSALLLGANCAVLGVAIMNVQKTLDLGKAVLSGAFGGVGFLLALVLMEGVRERLETSKVPEPLKGMPITLISAALIAMAFAGFTGIA